MARREQLLRPWTYRPSLPEKQEGDLGDVLSRKQGAKIRLEILPNLRRVWPHPAPQDGIDRVGDAVIGDRFDFLRRRPIVFREAEVDAPADRVSQDIAGDAIKEQAGASGKGLHDTESPRVLNCLCVHENAPRAIVRGVLPRAFRLDNGLAEAKIPCHLASEAGVKVAVLLLKDPARQRLEVHLPVDEGCQDAPAIKAATQRQDRGLSLQLQTPAHGLLEDVLNLTHRRWAHRPRPTREPVEIKP
jgi:hypothetical protein